MRTVGWHLVRLVHEATNDLAGGTVEAIRFHPALGRLLLTLGSRRGKRLVVIGVRATGQAFFWVSDKDTLPGYTDFEKTERFNRLRGCHLHQAAMPQSDRLIRLSFQRGADEDLERKTFDMWLSWSGGSGNVWLLQQGDDIILETLWPLRTADPGQRFTPPTRPALLSWQALTFPEYLRAREAEGSLPLRDFVCKKLWGIDEALADVIEEEAGAPSARSNPSWSEFEAIMRVTRAATDPATSVALLTIADGTDGIVPVLAAGPTAEFRSLAAALAALDGRADAAHDRDTKLAQLRAQTTRTINQLRHRLAETDRAIVDGPQAETIKRQADLLGSQRHLIRRGMPEVSVKDWESDTNITLSLDPARSPQENIDALYRRARKTARAAANADRSKPALQRQLDECEERLSHLNDPSLTEEGLNAIQAAVGQPPGDLAKRRAVQPRRLPYREFTVGNETILVGRSSRDNDELTLRIASPDDLFFHASQSGGAHVILRRGAKGRIVGQETIVAAAQIAAFFSKARHSTLVPVVYTETRHVRKPRKAPAGLVQLTHEKSIMVRPIQPPGFQASNEKN